MTWNYRVLAHECQSETVLIVHEVHYNENNEPAYYADTPARIMGNSVKQLRDVTTKMILDLATRKPVLYAGVKFPQIYTK